MEGLTGKLPVMSHLLPADLVYAEASLNGRARK